MLGGGARERHPINPEEDGMATEMSAIQAPEVVSHEEWVSRRAAFLAKEKEFTRLRDELTQERSELPWEEITRSYVFEGPSGQEDAGGAVRGQEPADRLPLHVRPGVGCGVQELLVRGRQLRRLDRAPRRARHRVRGDLAGAVREDRELQAAHGVEVPVAVVVRHRVQLRLRRHDRRDPHRLQLRRRSRCSPTVVRTRGSGKG